MNQFNLGQSDISTGLLQSILTGNQQESGGGILSALIGAGGQAAAAGIALSSAKFKTDIEPVEDTAHLLEMVDDIDIVNFKYHTHIDASGKTHVGFILDDSDPQLGNEKGHIDVDIFGVLLGAIKEQSKQIKALQEKVA